MNNTIIDNGKLRTIPRNNPHTIVTNSKNKQAMRTTVFYMLLLLFLACTKATAQKIVLISKNTPFKTVIQQIQKQSGYSFAINDRHMRMAKTVTITAKDKELKEVLNEIFSSQPFGYMIDGKVIVSVDRGKEPQSQIPIEKGQEVIKGKVSNEKGEALAGASVRVKGTTIDFLTDASGIFEIPSRYSDAILQVSYIGYARTEISAREANNIVLNPSSNTIDIVDVVSTGYQTLPKERATGSFTTVNEKLYNEQVGTDVLSRLEYIANGVSVFRNNASRTSQLMVRGISTIQGPTSPLIILDNFPYEGDVNNINPNDVENVTVLKDAAASSIWGAKAGNGVIVITTKKGKFNQPLQIDVNSSVTIGSKPNLDYLTPISTGDLIDMEIFLFNKGYYNSDISGSSKPAFSKVVELLLRARNGTISTYEADAQINTLRNLDVRNDFKKYMYQTSSNQQYYLNVKGGSEKMNYLFSTGYDNNVGNLANKLKRLNLRSEASFKPFTGMVMNAGMIYTNTDNISGKPPYSETFRRYQMLADENGNAILSPQTYSQIFKETEMQKGNLLDWNYYPLDDYKHSVTTNNVQDILATFSAQYKVIEPLTLDIRYQYEKQQNNKELLNDQQSYFTRNLINSFTQITDGKVIRPIPNGAVLDKETASLTNHSFRAQLNFDKTWKNHSLTLIAGEEIRQITKDANRFRTYGFNPETLTGSFVDFISRFPNYATKRTATIPSNNGFSKTMNRFISFYTNGAYTYENKYTLSASVRRDASNLFGVNTNDKWKPLWSSGLSWLLSDEKFYHFDPIAFLKIRATYGFSGNIDPSMSAVTTIFYPSVPSEFTGDTYAVIKNFYNPDLRWEKVKTSNFAIDFRFKNNRIWGSIDYYQKRAEDLFSRVPVDYTIGVVYSSIVKNSAKMKGSGLDLEVHSININKKFKWQTVLNFNYYKDKITELVPQTLTGNSYTSSNSLVALKGYPVWSVFAYRSAGLDNEGNPQGYLNGEVSKDYASITGDGTKIEDIKYMGPRFPVFYGTLGNTLTYKSLSLSIRMSYSFGNFFRRQSINYSDASRGQMTHSDYAKRWQKPGDELNTDVPSFVYPFMSSRDNFYNASETLIEKADCIRLQYINVGYSFTSKNNKQNTFKTLQLFVNANNLGILWRANKYGIDPDYTFTNSNIPPGSSVSLGCRLGF